MRAWVHATPRVSAFISQLQLALHAHLQMLSSWRNPAPCAGGLSEKEAFLAAVNTWPEGVRPVVHWSESQPGKKPHAHSDYVKVGSKKRAALCTKSHGFLMPCMHAMGGHAIVGHLSASIDRPWRRHPMQGPIFLHGLEQDVDVMIEAKCKEQALLCYRDGIPIPEQPAAVEPPPSAEDAVALKLLD